MQENYVLILQEVWSLMASFTYTYQSNIALHLELFKRGIEKWEISTVSC